MGRNIALLKTEDGLNTTLLMASNSDYMAYVRSHNLRADRGSVIGRAVL